jgi:hypothetical protein
MEPLSKVPLALGKFLVVWMVGYFSSPTTHSMRVSGSVPLLLSPRKLPISVLQDWSITLSSGGTLCIVPKHKLMNDLGSIAESLDVTFVQLTPTGE